jgi:hypothetical protein
MTRLIWISAIVLMGLLPVLDLAGGRADKEVKLDFEGDSVGKPPAGLASFATGDGPEGKWVVQEMAGAPSGKHVVVQTSASDIDGRFPVLVLDKGVFGDVDVSVRGKAISGKIDQGIGLVFRFRDPKSYYICRANALEDNFRLYKMVNGRRLQFAGATVKVTSGQWHTLRAVAIGDHIVCYYDGKALIDAHDKTYDKGKVGIWTKADSIIAFDDLTASIAK